MADFFSPYWSWFITIPTLLGLIYCALLALGNAKTNADDSDPESDDNTMGHVWDGDLAEYNNPLPKWWLNMFLISIAFALIYLALYPGLGTFQGLLGWSSQGQYQEEVRAAEELQAPLYAKYLATPVSQLSKDDAAMASANRLFANNCAICHGTDARGATGFPNLRDADWLYGGDENAIKTTLVNGRSPIMPAWGAPLGEAGVSETTEFVYSLSHDDADATLAEAGKARYMTFCVACHGAEAQGNPLMGAPNLSDNIWLYGGSKAAIADSIAKGRQGKMPSFADHLHEGQIHLMTSYLLQLEN